MTSREHLRTQRAAQVVADAAEQVFSVVEAVRSSCVMLHQQITAEGRRLCADDVATLRPQIQHQLGQESDLIVGLGMIVAPDLLRDQPLCLEWWQAETGQDALVSLRVDLKQSSPGFYDYAAAEWFDVPRQTGRRHIVGPYVDVHGTGRYVLTLTVPVLADGTFLGVAGADVSAPALERRLIAEFGSAFEVLVVNPDQRIVLSNSSRRFQGDRAPDQPGPHPETRIDLPDLPWQVRGSTTKPLTSEV